jgi:hypothetical protein
MALPATLLKPTAEATEAGCNRWIVRIVARRAGYSTRRQPMALIKRKLRSSVLMTTDTLGYSRQRVMDEFFVVSRGAL